MCMHSAYNSTKSRSIVTSSMAAAVFTEDDNSKLSETSLDVPESFADLFLGYIAFACGFAPKVLCPFRMR